MDDWLVLRDLSVGYGGRPVTRPFTFSLPKTEPVFAIVGRSGVGKTTLLHTLGGYLPPCGGTVNILGAPPNYRSGDLPIVFQNYGLFPWKSAIGNVEFALKCQGVPRSERRARALQLLDLMEVAEAADCLISALSGGMAQRVSLARALGADPKCLLLDEPFSALDAVTKRAVLDRLGKVLREVGIHAVMVTHNLNDALDIAQNILVVRKEGGHLLVNRVNWQEKVRAETLAMLQFELECAQ